MPPWFVLGSVGPVELDKSQINYLEQTLGVTAVTMPPSSGLAESVEPVSLGSDTSIEISLPAMATFLILSERPLNSEEEALIRNILKALGEESLETVIVSEFGPSGLMSLGSKISDKKLIAFEDLVPSISHNLTVGASQSLVSGNSCILVSALAPMLSPEESIKNAQKKKVWNQLKPLKSRNNKV